MKTFHCGACQSLIFFENSRCLQCGAQLAFVAGQNELLALREGQDGLWRTPVGSRLEAETFKLCANYTEHQLCNWAIPGVDAHSQCESCRLTSTIPNLSQSGSREAWAKLETAKRRLLYAIFTLPLPLIGKREDGTRGLEFRFLSDDAAVSGDQGRILTGHDNGVITINVAEADDAYRETQRQVQREPYRTLLGHFRHEIGHYYWDQLIANSDRLEEFRQLFGDERADYQQALDAHYTQGPPENWSDNFISAYASMHPWEDWAESWAHVLHMIDALETAQSLGLSIKPSRKDEPFLMIPASPLRARVRDFEQLIQEWSTLTYVLNNLTRGLGLADAYPFVLSEPTVKKLRFVCASMTPPPSPAAIRPPADERVSTAAAVPALFAAVTLASALCFSSHALAQAGAPKKETMLAGANTTDPAAPFYIDISGIDFSTEPPTRDPLNPKYPPATELPDEAVPSADRNGNFIIGPTHKPAAETLVDPAVPKGTVISFTMSSTDSVIYHPSLIRDESVFNQAIRTASTVPGDPSNLLVTSSHPGTWTRTVWVYIPKSYTRGKRAPVLVMGDGGTYDAPVFAALDNLISQHRIPALIAISIGNGGQDAQGSERGFEYDTVSGSYAEWVEREVLPRVEQKARVLLTTDPDGRASMGISSSGAAAFSMAWFHPEWYHRVLTYSPTMINQQWPHNPALRGGAWEYHSAWAGERGAAPKLNVDGFHLPTPTTAAAGSPLISNSPRKPIRFWFECGDRDLFYPIGAMTDGMHDWVLASEGMARVLASAGYQYQFVFARNAAHVDRPTLSQTLPEALEWVWKGYKER